MRVRFGGIELGQSGNRVGGVGISDIDFAYPEVRDSDRAREARDGVMPGRDYLGARTISIDCWTNGRTMREARNFAAQVLSRWRDETTRMAAGVLVPLEFQAVDDPTWRRVYGRPRRADDPSFGVVMRQGRAEFTLEFEVMDARFYAGGTDGLVESTIRVVAGSDPGPGLSAPLVAPLRTVGVAERRSGFLAVGGEVPTPAVVEFYGPGSRFSLDGNRGWHVGLDPSVTLAWDEVVTIDPLAGTVSSNIRGNFFGALDRRSGVTSTVLVPGSENVFFSAVDVSNTARAVVSWRPAFSSAA